MHYFFFFAMFFFHAAFVVTKSAHFVRAQDYVSLIGGLLIPWFLLLAYGLAGAILILSDISLRPSFSGIYFEDKDIAHIYFVACLGAAAYYLGFLVASKNRRKTLTLASVPRYVPRGLMLLLWALLFFDLYVRIRNIQQGTYFSWMRRSAIEELEAQFSTASMLQEICAPLIAVLLVWRAKMSRAWYGAVVAFLALVFLEGSRKQLFLIVAAAGVAHLYLAGVAVTFRKHVLPAIGGLTFLLVAGSLIVGVRGYYRMDRTYLLENPAELPGKIVLEYIPNILMGIHADAGALEETRFSHRVLKWSGDGASIVSRISGGAGYLPTRIAMSALAMPIPSLIWPGEKPVAATGEQLANYYSVGLSGSKAQHYDLGSTVFSDVYFHFAFPGVLLLGFVMGISYASFANYLCRQYGTFGPLLFFGLLGVMLINYNSFGNALVNLRDGVLLVVIISTSVFAARLRLGPGQTR